MKLFERCTFLRRLFNGSAGNSDPLLLTTPFEAEYKDGIFVDVMDTLIIQGKLNLDLLAFISVAKKQGINVTVFTNGTPEKMRDLFVSLGADLKEEFDITIENKRNYKDCKIGILIDDTGPESQRFFTDRHLHPLIISVFIRDGANVSFTSPAIFIQDIIEERDRLKSVLDANLIANPTNAELTQALLSFLKSRSCGLSDARPNTPK